MQCPRLVFRAMSTKFKRSSYPRWSESSQRPSPVAPKRAIPRLLQPPSTNCPNTLPTRKPISLPRGFISSRHISPAAYPRSFAESTGDLSRASTPFTAKPGGPGESSEARKKRNLGEAKACVRARLDASPSSLKGGQLWLAGERWVRKEGSEGKGGLTLVVSAANGFTKESWMPTIRRLIEAQRDPMDTERFGTVDLPKVLTTTRIDEVWFLDDYHHGQSMDLNKGLIGPVHSWLDGGRDIVNFVRHVLPSSSRGDVSETLEWNESHSSSSGTLSRKVIGLGHSVGGNAIARAAHIAPELFHAIFLVEPMTPPIHATHAQLESPDWVSIFWRPVITLRRRTTWPTMAEALKVRSSPFFSSWHDEVFKVWETHHLVPLPSDQGVTLATPSWAEAAVFSETTGLGEGWDALPDLRVPCAFLMAGDAGATLGEDLTREMVWRPPLAVNERIMDAGHLIVHEKPDEVANAISRFLSSIEIDEKKQGVERAKL